MPETKFEPEALRLFASSNVQIGIADIGKVLFKDFLFAAPMPLSYSCVGLAASPLPSWLFALTSELYVSIPSLGLFRGQPACPQRYP